MTVVKYLHLLAAVVWFGTMIFYSFIATPAVFRAFPRETAGEVVGALFPKYFLVGYVSSLVMLATLAALWRGNFSAVRAPLAILALMAALAFISGMGIGARAHALKAEIRTADTVQKEELQKAFKRIHGLSMALNLALIVLALVYLGYLPAVMRM